MAGTAVTTQEVRKFGGVIAERLITIVFTSDAAGSVPDEAIDNLYNYYLDEIITLPDSTSPPTSAYRVAVTDTDGGILFLGEDRSLTVKERQGGSEYNGKAPGIDEEVEVKLLASDGSTAVNLGNAAIATVVLRLKRK